MPKGKANVEKMTVDSLEAVVNKRWGAGTMMRASDPKLEIVRLPTGILAVDALIGGGFARNRHFEIFGSAGVGKNYVCNKLMATTQQNGGRCAFIDVEKTFDPRFAAHTGLDLDQLVYHKQKHGPQVVDFTETLLRSGLFDVIILDSIATLLPMAEYENDMEAGSYGMEQAKLMSKALRKLTAANENTVLGFINQTREAIGVTFGKKTTTSGGRAMGFYAGMRLELVRTETLKREGRFVDHKTGEVKKGDHAYGHRVLVRGEKDKTGGLEHPLAETTFVFDYEKSAHDPIEDLFYLGKTYGLIQSKKKGTAEKIWVEGYEDEAQAGRKKFKRWLRKQKAIAEELEEQIREVVASRRDGWGDEDDEFDPDYDEDDEG